MAWEWVGPVATAVVGIAGIGSTLIANQRLTQTQHKLEHERELRDLKRGVYSRIIVARQALIEEMALTSARLRNSDDGKLTQEPKELLDQHRNYRDLVNEALILMADIVHDALMTDVDHLRDELVGMLAMSSDSYTVAFKPTAFAMLLRYELQGKVQSREVAAVFLNRDFVRKFGLPRWAT